LLLHLDGMEGTFKSEGAREKKMKESAVERNEGKS
jgi:hypothetical protein